MKITHTVYKKNPTFSLDDVLDKLHSKYPNHTFEFRIGVSLTTFSFSKILYIDNIPTDKSIIFEVMQDIQNQSTTYARELEERLANEIFETAKRRICPL